MHAKAEPKQIQNINHTLDVRGPGPLHVFGNMHAPQTGSQWWCCSAKSMQQEPRPCACKSGAKANSKHQPHPRCTWAWAITCIWKTNTHRRRGHNGGVAPPNACSRNNAHVHAKAEAKQIQNINHTLDVRGPGPAHVFGKHACTADGVTMVVLLRQKHAAGTTSMCSQKRSHSKS